MSVRIAGLGELGPGTSSRFGGKAEGLRRLLAAGARVPDGFAVEATREEPGDGETAIREEFRARVAGLLARGPVAVRSSAVGEDAASRSFAGLFETVLDVGSVEAAVEAVRRVVASASSPRVAAYAGGAPPPMGLVVQSLVAARAAGVCFTRDPAGRDRAVVVEAVAGSGEALVSGRREPARFRVYRSGLGRLETHVEGSPGALSVNEAETVAREATGLEAFLGEPLDLEWALDAEGLLWWLQARPITVLREPPSYVVERSYPDADDGPATVWSTLNVRETLPEPLYPLTWSHWRDELLPVVTHQVFGVPQGAMQRALAGLDLVNGRIAFNLNAFRAVPVLGALMVPTISLIDHTAGEIVRSLEAAGILTPRRLPGSRFLLALRGAVAGIRSTARFCHGLFPRRALRVLAEDSAAIAARPDVASLSDWALEGELGLFTSPVCFRLLTGLQMEAVAMIVYGLARHAFRHDACAAALLGSGIPAGPTTEISLGIDALVATARPLAHLFARTADPRELLARLRAEPAAAGWCRELDAFLVRFGHRGPSEFDLAATRWGEDPSMIVSLVRESLAGPPREGVRERMARLAGERARVLGDSIAASPLWKRPLLSLLARAVPHYMPLREAPKHYGVVVIQRIRQAAFELGRRLAAREVLSRAEDVFLLDVRELRALASGATPPDGLRAALAEREERLARFRAEPPPDFLRSDGVPVREEEAPESGGDGLVRGAAVSPGVASGPVRRLATPDPSAMKDGDVLVLVFADPGWTPLFPRAAAVVMEVGGLMCHAAVVARELGVPAVFGVRNATRVFAEGERVVVDGGAGTVSRELPGDRAEGCPPEVGVTSSA
ncbi:MAG: PEP/pyruvate-binding domain-containing protein [Thermoanaerobaculia bacterium]